MSIATITADEAKLMVDDGALLIDIRSADEHRRENIPGAKNQPVDTFASIDCGGEPVVFHCKTGTRTSMNAAKLAVAANGNAFIIEGGLSAWKKAGLPVVADKKQPIEIQCQVQITAGLLMLIGIALSLWVAPGYIAVSAFVAAGLTFAGVTGWCGMAKLFSALPWNRQPMAAS